MRKPDDDLKIDISEIFGGELSGPSDSIDEAETGPPNTSQAAVPTPAETENNFQDWMNSRNTELEAKAQDLEIRLQEMQAQLTANQAVGEIPAPPVSPSMSTEAESPVPEPPADSPIDFNAPIAPPFMGNNPVAADPVQENQAAPSETSESPALPDPQKVEELKKLQADYEFLMLYDEFRNIIAHELIDLVGEKKTYTMLGRTVELARTKYPEVFRNANWDGAGNLLEDGSVDSQRVIENKNAMDPVKADLVLDTALFSLLNLRLQAVEKGLGTGLKNKVRAHLYQWISEKVQKADREGKDPAILRRLNGYVAQIN
jgi:hypothetical protein